MLKWLNKLVGRADVDSRRVYTRVQMPTVHEVPQYLLTALRAVNDDLDVYFIRGGDAWLLQRQENTARIQEGRLMLVRDREDDLERFNELNVSAHLMAQGFALLGITDFQRGMSAGFMVGLAQSVLHKTRVDMERENAELRSIADSSAQAEAGAALIRDRIRSNAKSDWDRVYRGKRHFSSTR